MTTKDTLGKLRPAQRKAIAALMQAHDVSSACKLAGVSRAAMYRWLRSNDFKEALAQAQSDALDAALRRLSSLTGGAVTATEHILADGSESNRLKAASMVFDWYVRLKELDDLEARIAALEAGARHET